MRKTLWISLSLAAYGLSASSQTVPTINACVNNLNGATRVVAASTNCINGVETFKQWNITGPQGPQGTQGPAGPQGPQGFTGSPGQRGAMGLTGPAGPTGNTGAQGPQGPQGDTGAQGSVGPIGPAGTAGPAGVNGRNGPQGPAGPTGPAGPSGPTGPAGTPGGLIFLGNEQLPAGLAQPSVLYFPLVGSSTPSPSQAAAMVPRPPNACATAQNLTFTVLSAPGTSTMDIYLLLGAPGDSTLSFTIESLCSVTANSGKPVSCTAASTEPTAANNENFFGLLMTPDGGFRGATVTSILTCP